LARAGGEVAPGGKALAGGSQITAHHTFIPMLKYIAAFLVIFAVLVFLKFCEGSPFRTWKSILLIGLPIGFLTGYYLNHAFLPKPPPAPQAQKASAYGMEMARDWRRIPGVSGVDISGNTVRIDFADFKPMPEVKSFAHMVAGSASYFLRTNNQPIHVKVKITQQGKDRYEMDYEPNKGVVDEQEF
jgi:hypothetical protein